MNSQAIADFAAVMEETRNNLRDVESQLSEVQQEIARVTNAPPHTDDIIGVFMRGLQEAKVDFEKQLAAKLTTTYAGSDGSAASAASRNSHLNLVRLQPQKGAPAPDLNNAVVTYFLREKIAEEIPALVDRLFPASRSGMNATDRTKALTALNAKRSDLDAKREQLLADLGAGRRAVQSGAGG